MCGVNERLHIAASPQAVCNFNSSWKVFSEIFIDDSHGEVSITNICTNINSQWYGNQTTKKLQSKLWIHCKLFRMQTLTFQLYCHTWHVHCTGCLHLNAFSSNLRCSFSSVSMVLLRHTLLTSCSRWQPWSHAQGYEAMKAISSCLQNNILAAFSFQLFTAR